MVTFSISATIVADNTMKINQNKTKAKSIHTSAYKSAVKTK